jgi:hypothetical protein|nr:MAG TPA: hypothetical protein [Caudoviricetes sp.]
MKNFYFPASSEPSPLPLTGEEGVRRIFVFSNTISESKLMYKKQIIGFFNINNNIEIEFRSYYGFPKISNFSILPSANTSIRVLIDTVPTTSVRDDYFEG